VDEPTLLLALRGRIWKNVLRGYRHHSTLKIAFVSVFFTTLWILLFYGLYRAFLFLNQFSGLEDVVLFYLFSIYFLALAVMLSFSNAIIIYGSLYRSKESEFLLSCPVAPEHIFLHKFVETVFFSSWAFVFLGAPFLLAFGLVHRTSWSFYPLSFLYLLIYLLIPAALGSLATMILVTFFPRRIKSALLAIAAAMAAGGVLIAYRLLEVRPPGGVFTPVWVQQIFGKISFTQHPLLPSRWATLALMDFAGGLLKEGTFYLALTFSNALLLFTAAYLFAARFLMAGFSDAMVGRKGRRRRGRIFERIGDVLFRFLPPQMRLVLLKDIKTFRRSPVQWTQFLVFFGLLAVYFLNLRQFAYDVRLPYWRNLVSFLNLLATCLTLATFTGRFIFPLLSLEGRKFWVLGLLPISKENLVWGKFIFSLMGALLVSTTLVVLSDAMLRIEGWMLGLHLLLTVLVSFGLSGIAVGLGARFPNFREDNPSKIVSGFGGTLCLMLSLFFIVALILPPAVLCHLYYVREALPVDVFRWWAVAAVGFAVLLGGLAGLLPLLSGVKHFPRAEF